jgi:hypothetical protein
MERVLVDKGTGIRILAAIPLYCRTVALRYRFALTC